MDNTDLEIIAEQIKKGFTSGQFSDGEEQIYWELSINKWSTATEGTK